MRSVDIDAIIKKRVEESFKRMFSRHPHKCPFCGSPAYIGLASLDCFNECNVPKRRVVYMEIMGNE